MSNYKIFSPFQVQYDVNGGKCGVCGDPWNGPRENEVGGKYANGIIVRKYEPGQVIRVVVDLTANHKGWFEFRVCPNDNPSKPITQECLDRYVLRQAKNNQPRYMVPSENGRSLIKVDLKLPSNLRCKNCVLQWKYNAGNSWGTDPVSGRGCIGCGNQEQFYGCADIAIGYDDIMIPPHNTLPADAEEDTDDKRAPPAIDVPDWQMPDDRTEPADMHHHETNQDLPQVNEALEQFMKRMYPMPRGSESFRFLPILETSGVHPCMCICKTSPVQMHGGTGNIEVKLFDGNEEDKQVCMCMCQNSAKSLHPTIIMYLIQVLVLTMTMRLRFWV